VAIVRENRNSDTAVAVAVDERRVAVGAGSTRDCPRCPKQSEQQAGPSG